MRLLKAVLTGPTFSVVRRLSSKVRNVGIMAHIDAGKTTTTERMLYYSGHVSRMGEVHHGDTVMDYMEQERDRGITIVSAGVTFMWQGHQVNLVDTPGHVDFTIEVERSLRVLDGAVLLLDGSAGVEAQTMTVWRQARRNKVPKIAYINKLDKSNADLDMTLESMRTKLGLPVLLTQLPIYDDHTGSLVGLTDLVKMQDIKWDQDTHGKVMTKAPTVRPEEASLARYKLIEALCDHDDLLAELVLADENYDCITEETLDHSLRRATANGNALVTLCGASYKNIGVQPLLDGVVKYLPAPEEIHHDFLAAANKDQLCAMAFKIIHQPTKGVLTYVRMYSGNIKEGDSLYNMTRECSEKVQNVYIACADQYKAVKEVGPGQIAVVTGLKQTVTGDTLVCSKRQNLTLAGVSVPDPVFYCTIEPPSLAQQKQLELALANLSREDPSLRVSQSEDKTTTILSGMGELHLEILKERILKEYKVDADLGPIMVLYKEAATCKASKTVDFTRVVAGATHHVTIEMSAKPADSFQFDMKLDNQAAESVRPWQLKAVHKGMNNAVSNGPLLGYPVVDTAFALHSLEVGRGTSGTMISAAVNQAVLEVLKLANVTLLEPVMKVTLQAETEVVTSIVHDILLRRGHVDEREDHPVLCRISATVPLSELKGYSTHLRTITSGKAFFGMEFSHYEAMEYKQQAKAIEAVTGFAP